LIGFRTKKPIKLDRMSPIHSSWIAGDLAGKAPAPFAGAATGEARLSPALAPVPRTKASCEALFFA
jgi:hypothetical protein